MRRTLFQRVSPAGLSIDGIALEADRMLLTAYPSAADAAAHSATPRTLYCGLVKRQLVPVAFPGPTPALRTLVTTDG